MRPEVRQAAWEASRGWCVACGRRLGDAGVVHHRQAKGMGGRRGADRITNLIVLHDACHKKVHANPTAARDAGLIVPSWRNPADVPVGRLRNVEGL